MSGRFSKPLALSYKMTMWGLDEDKKPIRMDDPVVWSKFMEIDNRRVAEDFVDGPGGIRLRVSTVFLAIDHNFTGKGDPILWETMIFAGDDGDMINYQERYASYEDALIGHAAAVEFAKTYQEPAPVEEEKKPSWFLRALRKI